MALVPDGLAVQLDLVGQANANLQVGVAFSEAQSGDVNVYQSGSLTAGGDGIDAESKAVAVAKGEQEAKQKNKNESTLTAEGGTTNQQQQQQQQQQGGTQQQQQQQGGDSSLSRWRPSLRRARRLGSSI